MTQFIVLIVIPVVFLATILATWHVAEITLPARANKELYMAGYKRARDEDTNHIIDLKNEIVRLNYVIETIKTRAQSIGDSYLEGARRALDISSDLARARQTITATTVQAQPELDFDRLFQNVDFPLLESVNEQIDL